MKAKLAYFYSWSSFEIDNMDFKDAVDYFNAIEVIEAQNMILGIKVASYPHLKEGKDRDKIMRDLNRIAFPIGEEKPLLSTDDFFKVINGR